MITNRILHPKKYLVQPKCLYRLRNKLFLWCGFFFSGTVDVVSFSSLLDNIFTPKLKNISLIVANIPIHVIINAN